MIHLDIVGHRVGGTVLTLTDFLADQVERSDIARIVRVRLQLDSKGVLVGLGDGQDLRLVDLRNLDKATATGIPEPPSLHR